MNTLSWPAGETLHFGSVFVRKSDGEFFKPVYANVTENIVELVSDELVWVGSIQGVRAEFDETREHIF